MEEVEIVFHLAALASVPRSVAKPLQSNEANATATLKLLRAAARARVRRVVYASSSSVYGDRSELPKRETLPPQPLSPYAVSKLAGEIYCKQASRHWGIETVSLRFFNVYGPRQDPGSPYAAVIPIFFSKLRRGEPLSVYGDGTQTRDFTYVEDVVRGLLLAAEAADLSGRVLNLAGGAPITVLELTKRMGEIVGIVPQLEFLSPRPGDVPHSYSDPLAVKTALGFCPSTPLEEGLRKAWEWFRHA